MPSKNLKSLLIKSGLAASVLLAAVSAAQAQNVSLTASPVTATLPDGSTVPMWGYTCTAAVAPISCTALNPAVQKANAAATNGLSGQWSPIVITVPYVSGGPSLSISLTNGLSFANGNSVPTSLTIVGQVGGGLGTGAKDVPSPSHPPLTVTWPVAGAPGSFTPPAQPNRVQSFATEVLAGSSATLTWNNLKPGTYLIESGTHPSIQGPMGLYGVLVVTSPPVLGTAGTATVPATAGTAGTAYTIAKPLGTLPGTVSYDSEIPLVLSEIDPIQNTTVSLAVNTKGFFEGTVWSGQTGGCGNPTSTTYLTCYPPAVNYTPLYYLINGVAFNKTNASASLFSTMETIPSPAATANPGGSVLVRLVNAGLRMHVPSIVGAQTLGAATTTTGAAPVVNGFALVAEDGNPVPGSARVQSDVFMAAGKTYDVMINGVCTPLATGATCTNTALPIFDRQLSLSGNGTERDAGMVAYIGINQSTGVTALPAQTIGAANPFAGAAVVADTYNSLIAGQAFTVSDPSKGVIANDTNVYGVKLLTGPTNGGTVVLNSNGTFTYTPSKTATSVGDSFTYCANGTVTGTTCSSGLSTTVTLNAASVESATALTLSATPLVFNSTMATYMAVKPPGLLAGAHDAGGFPLKVDTTFTPKINASGGTAGTILFDANGGFTASNFTTGSYVFTYQVINSQGVKTQGSATVNFPTASGLAVNVLDTSQTASTGTITITDYRWVIEEDKTFYNNPICLGNPSAKGCSLQVNGQTVNPIFGVNFHTSYMPFVAQGCTGPLSCASAQTVLGQPAVCDIGNGVCRTGTATGFTPVLPSQVHLDPTKRYYISILPGDAANPFLTGYTGTPNCGATTTSVSGTASNCGHGMGGAPITVDPNTGLQATTVTVLTQPSPYPPGKLSVMVFEDDFPLNGEQDGGGGVDVLSPQEPGLGGFQIHLWDAMGGNGDFTGQMTYDMFNQPLTNSLDGMMDPATGKNACPITQQGLAATAGTPGATAGITGMIVTCPKYEADGTTLSPLAGQAVIANLMPGRWGVIATPAADRIARGEEWLQTNTLDGQKAHDSFVRIGEPAYFQEFGPASFHVTIGFANPAIINSRHAAVCNGTDNNITGPNCSVAGNGTAGGTGNILIGRVTGEHLSRTPDERLFETTTHDAYAWTQCYVSLGDPDGEDFAFTKCDANGNFKLINLPDGDWRVTVFDQWNDQLVDGLSTPVRLASGATSGTTNMGDIAGTQWETDLQTKTFIDDNKDGIFQGTEGGIPFANVAVRLRDGSLENLLVTDFTGTANFNETFPLFSWYVVETDVTRYKNSGTHVVYDAGGPVDGTLTSCGGSLSGAGYPACGNSTIAKYLSNTAEQVSLDSSLNVPGSIYCSLAIGADCTGLSVNAAAASGINPSPSCTNNGTSTTPGTTTCTSPLSTGRIDSPLLGGTEGWQGFPGQFSFLEFGKTPYVPGETGGIVGHVVYASTRPFDDPMMLVQVQWTPLVPHVTMNLYQEGFAADGVTPTLNLVDTTTTSSWDDWAQGFRSDGKPNMNCPGQTAADLFFFTLLNQPQYLDYYTNVLHGSTGVTALPFGSQFKCYDGMHNWNQLQPAPYDGMYAFPSNLGIVPATGKYDMSVVGNATGKSAAMGGTNCTICVPNPDKNDPFRFGTPMLPPGKYVVEVVLPPGYELVKEEDKNILIGDNFIAPVTQQFGGLGNIFIVPDQASIGAAYNANNAQNPTQALGTSPLNGIVPGFIPDPVWPCVGEMRVVPDFISLYPQTKQVSPFAGATRPLCDRKEVTLAPQMHAIAKFYIFTSTHIAAKFTGGITDDYTSEFDPFSPQFGEKFAPPQLPVAVKDWAGNETNRVYADNWGAYNGMTYSTWEVNPPNPTGYSPTMMVFCMNDPGPIKDTRIGSVTNGSMITDPLYSFGYSQFCYELPFMPGTTQYLDTPVVPTSAFAGAGYNNVDCAYPDTTPAISSVISSDIAGPWAKAVGSTLTITALGDVPVPNHAYSGPSFTTAPFNTKTTNRHYGFGLTQGTGTVTIGGAAAKVTSWNDTQIKVTVPSGIPNCAVQQQAIYGGSKAQCGELVITAANGKQSIDTVTVTVGGKMPTVLAASNPLTQYAQGAIQNAIDAAMPGDMIIVPPGVYNEMVIMWKPVRLQGVGAATSIINGNTQPAGKLDPWRRKVNCLFGLALNGTPISSGNPYDATSDTSNNGGPYTCPAAQNFSVDRLALEATVGWDATLNGNLAQLLQEPTLMGALEGAVITVVAKGVQFPLGSNPFASDTFPTGTTLLTAANCLTKGSKTVAPTNPYPSNFQCNPSAIDGLGLTDSSQGGGGIFVHAWGHNLQIANNRIENNAGTLSGGINLGQGEFPPAYIAGGTTNADPGSCATDNFREGESYNGQAIPTGAVMPYCHNLNVNIHNNYISLNSSTGDELFSSTPAGAGGVSICTGADSYKFNWNWICGNLSSGDGGGFGHIGFSYDGDIEHNTFLFNQSLNPTIPANGGAMIIMGAPDVDPTCGTVTDADCLAIGVSDGVGPNLVINANLIMGNGAEAGTGGGISFQNVNGSDVVTFPTQPQFWNNVSLTNNIIANNVAGWDGGGISLLDTLNINIVNNTIIDNVSTATAGVLFNTIGSPTASQTGPTNTCTTAVNCGSTSAPQVAGVVALQNSASLMSGIGTLNVVCPVGHYQGATSVANATNGTCKNFSYPELYNNVIWQNATYYIGVGALSPQYQQNIITMYNSFTGSAVPTQPTKDSTAPTPNGGVIITGGTGACTLPGSTGAPQFWDLGVRGDTGPTNHAAVTLAPQYSLISSGGYAGTNLTGPNADPAVVSQYCNGSRQTPEACTNVSSGCGWQVPPGISDATVPNPIFNLYPVATVDEGNNWINLRWGPLALTNPSVLGPDGNYGDGPVLGNYAITAGSAARGKVVPKTPEFAAAPSFDFFGNPRPTSSAIDIGAVEYVGAPAAIVSVTPPTLAFGNVTIGTASTAESITLTNSGNAAFALTNVVITPPFVLSSTNCGPELNANATCTVSIVYEPSATGATSGTATVTGSVTVTGSPVNLSGTGVADVVSASLAPATWTTSQTRNCPGTGFFGNLVCDLDPSQKFTLTNTGNVPLTGVTAGVLGGTTVNVANYTIDGFLSTCGNASHTTLAPGGTCTVYVQFKPLTAQTTGLKEATVSVSDSAGTQTATLNGTAK